MKKLKLLFLLSSFILTVSFLSTSCSKKSGCPMNDPANVGAKTSKKGKMSTKRGKSSLFPNKKKRRG